MGFTFAVKGKEEIKFDQTVVSGVEFLATTPDAKMARSTDLGLGLIVEGKMNYSLKKDAKEMVSKLAIWSAEHISAECYREVTVQVIEAGQVVRQYVLPTAFVVEYNEELDEESGSGSFHIHMRQKKDVNADVKVTAGFELKK